MKVDQNQFLAYDRIFAETVEVDQDFLSHHTKVDQIYPLKTHFLLLETQPQPERAILQK